MHQQIQKINYLLEVVFLVQVMVRVQLIQVIYILLINH
uniref:Uncharacterized protein n=1 Tax=Myoviridae sp. ctjhW4 TaxID=2825162 RepID=A0A8S5PT23_9CAUD|nr:MAG TPA: hypothetical protein [Myoviridae sp. ctjhW4]